MRGLAQYGTRHLAGTSPRQTEAAAFRLANLRLSEAKDSASRIQALFRNQQMWSLLLKDLALSGNRLPEELKGTLIALGAWAQRYSTLAMAGDLPAEPLIAVNADMIEALEAQGGQMGRAEPGFAFSGPAVV